QRDAGPPSRDSAIRCRLRGQVAHREERQQDTPEVKAGPGVVADGQLRPAKRSVERAEDVHVSCAQRDDGKSGGNLSHVQILPDRTKSPLTGSSPTDRQPGSGSGKAPQLWRQFLRSE